MSKQFLGWDCANRTLAWSHVYIDTHIYSKMSIITDEFITVIDSYLGSGFSQSMIRGLTNEQRGHLRLNLEDNEFLNIIKFTLETILYFTDNFLQYYSTGVVDVLDGRKVRDTNEIERTHCLHKWLINSPDVSVPRIEQVDETTGYKTKAVIEHQPSKIGAKTNNKSTAVGYQLMFYYINNAPVLVNPKLKNNIELSEDLRFSDYITRELPKHKARKDAIYAARKTHSRDSFLFLLALFDLDYVTNDVSRGCLDDQADSVMQILAYLVENKLFV